MGPPDTPVVAFDFDGTLTTRDSFTGLLRWQAGPLGYAAGLLAMTPQILAYVGHRDRGRIKSDAIARFWGGKPATQIEQAAEAYAEAVGPRILRPDAVRTWRQWQGEGARMIIVTASPEISVRPFAHRLGADLLIGTRLALDDAGRITGALDGLNCRAEEKVVRLEQALGRPLDLKAAYGDTSGDHAMLAVAETAGYRVFKGRP